ncbi:hypothetical protein BD311DRAFT_806639 [Dichomitus squalens]|uniref:Fungal lipase-type domain-containing protein n=1 Tax=Dichomitus squalens TaxID=114155 RepID=A0A4Q9MRA7_9APHY|nr:hypothetical protein BD311DRAFT_806639 [Dichomitus squalens]
MALSLKASLSTAIVGGLLCARAAAVPTTVKRQAAITALSTAQIAAFSPYTHYAGTASCSPESTLAWDCGATCEANPSFEPVASGGDGAITQFWFVGFDPTLEEVIVGHQGTDVSKILPILEDLDIVLEKLDPTLFPGASESTEVHSGFAGSQDRWLSPKFLCRLGAAIGLLDSVFLPLHLPSTVATRFVGYGLPRVGNEAFANYVDAQYQKVSVTHMNNREDIIPILPGAHSDTTTRPARFTSKTLASGWHAPDNTDDRCIVGDVPNTFLGNLTEHGGPYGGIEMGC